MNLQTQQFLSFAAARLHRLDDELRAQRRSLVLAATVLADLSDVDRHSVREHILRLPASTPTETYIDTVHALIEQVSR